ncbi:MAG: B12-binding domain-containing radical SAM protein [Planctomycetota bacterium]|jgi:radical SAM superfamily enzyme YgiQ (UPF0313 family)
MRLLLINVNNKIDVRIPQGLLYLASAVDAEGHEVIVHDEALVTNPKRSREQILSYEADVVGLSVYTVPWQLKRMEELSKAVKEARKETVVVWGGWHAMLYYKHIILNPDVDIVVRGPGERTVCDILDALEQGRSLRSIDGLIMKEHGTIAETSPARIDPGHLYPPLNFNLVDLNTYLQEHDRGAGVLQYITTRGCHQRCRFCVMARLFKGHMIRKPKNQILSELRYLMEHYPISSIHLSDDNTFRDDREAVQLCDIISEAAGGRDIPWRCITRIDTLSGLSDDTYTKLVTSGCTGIVAGIESGVDRVLKLMGKRITLSQIQKALELLIHHGLHKNLFFFLFNFTGETEAEAVETVRLIRKIRLMLPQSDVNLNVFFPGVSDSSTMPLDKLEKSSPMSRMFDQYYEDHIRNYRVGGIRMKILRFYFDASGQRESKSATGDNLVRRVYHRLLLLRIKYGIFVLPFEYYLSNTVMKKIRQLLAWMRPNRHRENLLKKAK